MKTKSFVIVATIFIISAFAVLRLAGCGGGAGKDRASVGAGSTSAASQETLDINNAIQSAGAEWVAADNWVTGLPAAQRKQLDGAILDDASGSYRTMPVFRSTMREAQLPASVDWRNKDGVNWLTPIKNQNSCGSCVAFSTMGATEAMIRIANRNPILTPDLSEMYFFSCSGIGACASGMPIPTAFEKLKSGGTTNEACLPYQPQDGLCSSKCATWQTQLTKITGYSRVSVWTGVSNGSPVVDLPASQTAIKNALQLGPVVASIKVYTDFYHYSTGVYKYVTGAMDGGHAIAIVGYDDAGQYWIVRNSWGSSWGQQGYVYIKYGEVGIEAWAHALQVAGNPAIVTAAAAPASAALVNNQAVVTLTCTTSGSVSKLETRCKTTEAWAQLATGNTKSCTYTAAGSYVSGCRVNGVLVADTSPVVIGGAGGANKPPVASASANATTGVAPLAVNFTGGCTDPDGTCASYSWSFGDGTPTSSIQNASHTFSASGTFSVALTVTDNSGATNVKTLTITVAAAPTVTAVLSATSVVLSNGSAAITVTCNTTGTVTSKDARCTATGTWAAITTGNTKACAYAAVGSYTPGCRINGTIIGNAAVPVTVAAPPGVWLSVLSGAFIMGCATSDTKCYSYESPKHTVTVPAFQIMKYEVTNAQYKLCVAAGSCAAPSPLTSPTHTSYYGNAPYDNYPVINITWTQAKAYCTWAGGRLPSEAEWEKTARGPSPSEIIYPWSNTAPGCTFGNIATGVTTPVPCTGDTTAVGSYTSGAGSAYGPLDMIGNVMEFVEDDWHDSYTGAPANGAAWVDATRTAYRPIKGGAWNSSDRLLRISFRTKIATTAKDSFYGVRCAK